VNPGLHKRAAQKALFLGIGSPFGEDILGWQLLDALQGRNPAWPGYELAFAKVDRPGAGLLQLMQGQQLVVLLDALDAGLPKGAVRLLERGHLAEFARPRSSHSFGVAESLALGETLQMLPASLYLLGIQMGGGLPPQAVDAALAELDDLLERNLC